MSEDIDFMIRVHVYRLGLAHSLYVCFIFIFFCTFVQYLVYNFIIIIIIIIIKLSSFGHNDNFALLYL